jgi:hypothetical protein
MLAEETAEAETDEGADRLSGSSLDASVVAVAAFDRAVSPRLL